MTTGSRRFGFVVGCLLLGALPAVAGDGVREINQSCGAVGCWPGDDPGLPVRIVDMGSYRLTSNLLVDANTTAIEVAATDVSIDLGGFTIKGPAIVALVGGLLVCSSPGSGYGILGEGLGHRTAVTNGSVIGIAGPGGIVLGGGSRVEGVSVEEICGDGITAGITSSVVESRSRLAVGIAIKVGDASRVQGVIADLSGRGIATGRASVVADSIAASSQGPFDGHGMILLEGTVVRSSSIMNNSHDGIHALPPEGLPFENILAVNNYIGFNTQNGAITEDEAGFGGNVFNGNGAGAPFGVSLQCNSVNGVNFCPTHP